MEGQISQYNLEKEKTRRKEKMELTWLREMEGQISAEPGRGTQR
jgi:hypothetical protein